MADHADTLFLERLVKIPGFVDLSDAQQAAVCVRLNEIEYAFASVPGLLMLIPLLDSRRTPIP